MSKSSLTFESDVTQTFDMNQVFPINVKEARSSGKNKRLTM